MSVRTRPLATWTHKDSDPKRSLALALDTPDYAAPMNSPDRVHLVRSLAIATAYAVENARVIGVPPQNETELTLKLGSEMRGGQFATRAHCYAASTIARTWMLFADPGRHSVYTATTVDGQPAVFGGPAEKSGPDAGFPPLLLAAVAVVAIAGYAVAICYCGQAAATVVDRKLTQDALTARMISTHARAVAMVDTHSERERAAGHPIPWTPEELAILDTLLGTQREIAKRTDSPLPNPFEGAVEGAKKAADKAGETLSSLAIVAAVVGGVYVLTR